MRHPIGVTHAFAVQLCSAELVWVKTHLQQVGPNAFAISGRALKSVATRLRSSRQTGDCHSNAAGEEDYRLAQLGQSS